MTITVVVHEVRPDNALLEQREVVKSRRRDARRVVVPVLVVAWVAVIYAIVRAVQHDSVAPIVMLGSVAFVAIGTMILLTVDRRKLLRFPGRVWSSGSALFLGPHDDVTGLVGSEHFALANPGEGTLPPSVYLVMTDAGFEIVPTTRSRRTLSCSFADMASVEVTPRAEGRPGGLTFTLRDGRTASFLVSTDEELLDSLRQKGASVSHV